MKTLKQSFILFFGMLLMLFLTTFSQSLLKDLTPSLVVNKFGVELLSQLKWLAIVVSIVTGLLILALGNVRRAFKVYFPFNIAVLALLAILLFFQSSWLTNSFVLGAFYAWIESSMIVSIALLWGFANQEYTFKIAAIQYPLLGIIAGTSILFVVPLQMMLSKLEPNFYPSVVALAAVLNAFVLAIYLWISRKDLGAHENGLNVSYGYWIALGLLVLTMNMALFFPEIVFKSGLQKVVSGQREYLEYLGKLAFDKAQWGLLGAIASVLMGIFLYFKGSRPYATLLGLICLGMLMTGLISLYNVQSMKLNAEAFNSATKGYVYLVTFVGLFMLLKELLFFGIAHKSRFTAKIVIDVIFFSMVPFLSRLIAVPIIQMGPLNEHVTVIGVIFISALLVAFLSLYRLNRDLKEGLKQH